MRTIKKALLCLLSSLLLMIILPSFVPKTSARCYKRLRTDLFDTVCTFMAGADSPEHFEQNADLIFEELQLYNTLFNIYEEYEGINNLCTVNRMAGIAPVTVDARLIDFFIYMNSLPKEITDMVHPIYGALTLLWKEAAINAHPPEKEQLDEAWTHCQKELLLIDEEQHTLYLTDPDARLDVGAFAKGYAAKMCVMLLEELEIKNYMLSLGGNISVKGVDPSTGRAWNVGIQDPQKKEDSALLILQPGEDTVATSGTSWRYFTYNGKRYHHILDPDTLFPAERHTCHSVSVLTSDPALADALTTALFIYTPKEGQALLDTLSQAGTQAHALWIESDGTFLKSAYFDRYLPPAQEHNRIAFILLLLLCFAVAFFLVIRLIKDHKSRMLSLIALFAAIALLLLAVCSPSFKTTASYNVVVRYKGDVIHTMPLEQPGSYLFEKEEGQNLIIVDPKGGIYIEHANCPGNDCVKMGRITKNTVPAVISCVPHQLTVCIEEVRS